MTEAPRTAVASLPAHRNAADHGWKVLVILSMLMGFASLSTDLYLPAMPTIGQSLKADAGMIEWTVSGFLIGFSIGQLFWGPIGDRFGRRMPVALGLVLFVIGSAGCALADSALAMISWRVVQALGACAGVVLARAMVRDLYEGERAAQMLSSLMTIMAIAPLVGPIVGGQVLAIAGWRAIFWLLVGIGAIALIALATLPETLPLHHRRREPIRRALISYMSLLTNRRLLAYAGAGGFFYGGLFAYIAGTPFAYISYYHVSSRFYGALFGIGIVGIMATSLANAKLAPKIGSTVLLVRGTAVAALAGILLVIAARHGWGGLAGLVVPLFVFVGAAGFIVANSIAGALSNFPECAGTVSALVGAVQYGGGIAGSGLVGVFADGTPWPMSAVIALSGIGSFLCAQLLNSNKSISLDERRSK